MRPCVIVIAALFMAASVALGGEPPAGVTMILLERDACFGTCPEYSVRATVNGLVQYEGKSWVREFGRREGKLSRGDFQRLVQALDAADFDHLPSEFPCGELSTCATSMWITVMKDSNLKRVAYYFGCKGGPLAGDIARFVELGVKIDEIVGSMQWIGSQSERRANADDPN